jgi:hypothetical protein
MKNCSFISLLLVMVLSLMGCATPVAKPAFYPNAHYQHMGAAQAQADAHACADLANQSDVNAINKMDAARVGAAGAAGVATAGTVGSSKILQRVQLLSVLVVPRLQLQASQSAEATCTASLFSNV